MNIYEKIFEFNNLAKKEINLVNKIKREFLNNIDWNDKIIGLYGMRGVGKTTILFQKMEEIENSVYISMDWGFLEGISLFEIVKELYKTYKIKNFFIDEIHFFENWIIDLKNIYDLLPVKIVFSGSSKINIYEKGADLSRRVVFYKVPFFSFREYLFLEYGYKFEPLTFKDIFDKKNYIDVSSTISLEQLKNYLKFGQFGFFFENKSTYYLKLLEVTRKMLYEDTSGFTNVEKINKLEKLLYFVANTVQNEISFTSLGKKINLHPKTVENYLNILEKIGFFYNILKYGGNVTDQIRKELKPYFSSTNFIYLFCVECSGSDIVGKLRENFFVSNLKTYLEINNIRYQLYFKTTTDFVLHIGNKVYNFEIGGKNKDRKDVFVVKDDILIGNNYEIPLRIFAFLW